MLKMFTTLQSPFKLNKKRKLDMANVELFLSRPRTKKPKLDMANVELFLSRPRTKKPKPTMTNFETFVARRRLLVARRRSRQKHKLSMTNVEVFVARRSSKRVSFVKGFVAEADRASDTYDNPVVKPILRVKKEGISFEERQRMSRNDLEISNILCRRMPREHYESSRRDNHFNVWAHACFLYNNCPPLKFFDSFLFRQHFKKGYAVNNSGLPTVLEETEEDTAEECKQQAEETQEVSVRRRRWRLTRCPRKAPRLRKMSDEDLPVPRRLSFDDVADCCDELPAKFDSAIEDNNEIDAQDEYCSLDIHQDDEDCRPTTSSEDDGQDCDTPCNEEEEILPPPIELRRSPRLAKLAKSLEPRQPPRRSERLRKKPRVDYSVYFSG